MASTQPAQSSGVQLQIPERLKCANCRELARDAAKLVCCDSSICGSCVRLLKDQLNNSDESISDIVKCPVCGKGPMSKTDGWVDNPSLRTTISVFLRHAEKRARDSQKKAKQDPSASVVSPAPTESHSQSQSPALPIVPVVPMVKSMAQLDTQSPQLQLSASPQAQYETQKPPKDIPRDQVDKSQDQPLSSSNPSFVASKSTDSKESTSTAQSTPIVQYTSTAQYSSPASMMSASSQIQVPGSLNMNSMPMTGIQTMSHMNSSSTGMQQVPMNGMNVMSSMNGLNGIPNMHAMGGMQGMMWNGWNQDYYMTPDVYHQLQYQDRAGGRGWHNAGFHLQQGQQPQYLMNVNQQQQIRPSMMQKQYLGQQSQLQHQPIPTYYNQNDIRYQYNRHKGSGTAAIELTKSEPDPSIKNQSLYPTFISQQDHNSNSNMNDINNGSSDQNGYDINSYRVSGGHNNSSNMNSNNSANKSAGDISDSAHESDLLSSTVKKSSAQSYPGQNGISEKHGISDVSAEHLNPPIGPRKFRETQQTQSSQIGQNQPANFHLNQPQSPSVSSVISRPDKNECQASQHEQSKNGKRVDGDQNQNQSTELRINGAFTNYDDDDYDIDIAGDDIDHEDYGTRTNSAAPHDENGRDSLKWVNGASFSISPSRSTSLDETLSRSKSWSPGPHQEAGFEGKRSSGRSRRQRLDGDRERKRPRGDRERNHDRERELRDRERERRDRERNRDRNRTRDRIRDKDREKDRGSNRDRLSERKQERAASKSLSRSQSPVGSTNNGDSNGDHSGRRRRRRRERRHR
ncbi:hypothetical protein V1511DRAFT_497206 [Dipodascopsis uninucleata]